MTTFSFSICDAPEGDDWHRNFSNDKSRRPVVDLERLGVGGWAIHQVFVDWLKRDGIERHDSDWCQSVARCSREQLGRFIETLKLARQLPRSVSIDAMLDASQAGHFVVLVEEF